MSPEELHDALMGVTRRRAALDVEEARLLRQVEETRLWRHFGMVSPLDYLERKLGYTPHAANERLRVAAALGELREMEAAMERGELSFSAVRELSRVAVPGTERAWIDWAAGKNLRLIEDKVVKHASGDRPDDDVLPPEARIKRVWFEVSAETAARLREAQVKLRDDHGRRLDSDAFIATLCNLALDTVAPAGDAGRARYQIAVTVCEVCDRARQHGGGVQVPIDQATLERARCDATDIGSIDGAGPERASQDVPPSVVRFVRHRDGNACRVPGCRSAIGLEIHHLIHREAGGDHDPRFLVLVCGSCHAAHHRGNLLLSGSTDALEVTRPHDPDVRSHVGPDVKATLVRLGFSAATARDAVAQASATIGVGSAELLLREALRHCPSQHAP